MRGRAGTNGAHLGECLVVCDAAPNPSHGRGKRHRLPARRWGLDRLHPVLGPVRRRLSKPAASAKKKTTAAHASAAPAAGDFGDPGVPLDRRQRRRADQDPVLRAGGGRLAAAVGAPRRRRHAGRAPGTSSLEFVPAVGFRQSTHVTVKIPGGALGVRSAGGGLLAATMHVRFRVGTYQTQRLDELLAQLGYLPLTWASVVRRDRPGRHRRARPARRRVLAAAGPVQLEVGLPERAPAVLAVRQHRGPDPAGRDPQVRVRPRPDHGRHRRTAGVGQPAQGRGRLATRTRTATPTRSPTRPTRRR